jgi:hypothetical protein
MLVNYLMQRSEVLYFHSKQHRNYKITFYFKNDKNNKIKFTSSLAFTSTLTNPS